jgi:putative Holliday junction resolvase
VRPEPKTSGIEAPIMALDLGRKRVGVAVSDALSVSIRRLEPLRHSNWKRLLREVSTLIQRFDAQTLVIGLPLRLDGTLGMAAIEVKRVARNFAKSLKMPVFLQDERLTSVEALENLQKEGFGPQEILGLLDSESAAIILQDFLTGGQKRRPVTLFDDEVDGDD